MWFLIQREVTKTANLAALPLNFQGLRPAAHEYGLACAVLHSDVSSFNMRILVRNFLFVF